MASWRCRRRRRPPVTLYSLRQKFCVLVLARKLQWPCMMTCQMTCRAAGGGAVRQGRPSRGVAGGCRPPSAPRRAAWRPGTPQVLVRGLLSLLAAGRGGYMRMCCCARGCALCWRCCKYVGMPSSAWQASRAPPQSGIAAWAPPRQLGGADRWPGEPGSQCRQQTILSIARRPLQAPFTGAPQSRSRSQRRCASPRPHRAPHSLSKPICATCSSRYEPARPGALLAARGLQLHGQDSGAVVQRGSSRWARSGLGRADGGGGRRAAAGRGGGRRRHFSAAWTGRARRTPLLQLLGDHTTTQKAGMPSTSLCPPALLPTAAAAGGAPRAATGAEREGAKAQLFKILSGSEELLTSGARAWEMCCVSFHCVLAPTGRCSCCWHPARLHVRHAWRPH